MRNLNHAHTRRRAVLTLALALALALAAAATLTGCLGHRGERPAPPDARSTFMVTTELEDVPGVDAAFVSTGPNGLPGQRELAIGLDLSAGYPGDVATLLDYVLAMAWSANDEKPTTGTSVAFRIGESPVSLPMFAAELGLRAYGDPELDLSTDTMTDRYGPWPGPVPDRPAGLDSAVTDTGTEPPVAQ